jgi:hypothetical protein
VKPTDILLTDKVAIITGAGAGTVIPVDGGLRNKRGKWTLVGDYEN